MATTVTPKSGFDLEILTLNHCGKVADRKTHGGIVSQIPGCHSTRFDLAYAKIRGASAAWCASSVVSTVPSTSRYRPCPMSRRQRLRPRRLAS
ncbi:MAG: hypothetical protein QOF89_631 [Acidobacteriota bacterium]|nr:hypothetical protein [Acidobacteriota bacterium]